MPTTKQLSVRMPEDLVNRIANRGSAAAFIVTAVKEKLDREDRQALLDGFKLLAESPEMVDMEFLTDAQAAAVKISD